MKLGARELREVEETKIQNKLKKLKRQPLYFILENVYDTYNVGGLFRLADALAIEKIYLCGQTETPPNSKIKKASIGTYKIVPWSYKKTAVEAIMSLRAKRSNLKPEQIASSFAPLTPRNDSYMQIIAVEQHKNAVDYRKAKYSFPLALIFGNETGGIQKETLRLSDSIIEIPMWGINKSLNVIVSAAIVSYWVMQKRQLQNL